MARLGIVSSTTVLAERLVAKAHPFRRTLAVPLDPSYSGDPREFQLLIIDGTSVTSCWNFISDLLGRCPPSLPIAVTSIIDFPTNALPTLNGHRVWFLTAPLDQEALLDEVFAGKGSGGAAAGQVEVDLGVDLPLKDSDMGHGMYVSGLRSFPHWKAVSNTQRRSSRELLAYFQVASDPTPIGWTRENVRPRLIRFLVDVRPSTLLILACARCLRRIDQSAPRDIAGALRQLHGEIARTLEHGIAVDDTRVEAVLNRLHGGGVASGQLRQQAIARDIGVDPSHLSHLIRRASGFSFREWSVVARMSLALSSLGTTTTSIKRLAYDAGFGTCAHFDRCFRRMFSMSPSAFRNYYRMHTSESRLAPPP